MGRSAVTMEIAEVPVEHTEPAPVVQPEEFDAVRDARYDQVGIDFPREKTSKVTIRTRGKGRFGIAPGRTREGAVACWGEFCFGNFRLTVTAETEAEVRAAIKAAMKATGWKEAPRG